MPSCRRLELHYIAMQSAFWAAFAAICAYQAALLLARGFSNSQVGILIAVRCFAGIIFQPLLGGFADRHPHIPLRRIVSLSLVFSLAVGLLFTAVPMGMAGTVAVFIVLGGFEISAYPLMDAMAIQFINAGVPLRYSLGRSIGSLAYAIVCALLGLQAARYGVESTLITHAALVALEILLVATFPVFPPSLLPDPAHRERPHSAFYLLRTDPRFALMLLAILLGLTACLPISNFLVNVVESRGGGTRELGLALFLMGSFELPTAFIFQRLLRRFGSGRLVLMSLIFCTVKIAIFLFSASLGTIFAAQVIQILGYGLFTPSSVYFVNDSVPQADRVKGQTLMMVASNGFGGVLGSYVAGRALDIGAALPIGGVKLMLLCCLILGIAGVALAVVALRLPGRAEER